MARNKTLIEYSDTKYDGDALEQLLCLEESIAYPSRYRFDSNNNLFFLVKNEESNKMNLHYITLPEKGKECQLASKIKPLFTYKESNNGSEMSLEEKLMRERQRVTGDGITSYQFIEKTQQFLVNMSNSLYSIDIKESVTSPKLTKLENAGTFDSKLSPDGKLVAYVSGSEIWVNDTSSKLNHRLTWSTEKSKNIASGESKFVYCEEFSRYTGYWWRPTIDTDEKGNSVYTIFYFEENEDDVRDFHVPQHGYTGETTVYKYPLAGDKNSVIKMSIITFTIDKDSNKVNTKQTYHSALENQYNWIEYYVRGGWTPKGDNVWVQVLDRKQQRLALILIPLNSFNETNTNTILLLEENCPKYWLNVKDHISFFNDKEMVWSSESSGFCHLQLITWDVGYKNITRTPITSGSWVVGDQVWIDQTRKLVYFTANKDTPLESHLYVCNLYKSNDNDTIKRLTTLGYDHTGIQLNRDYTRFVSNTSSTTHPITPVIFDLEFNSGSQDGYPEAKRITAIIIDRELPVVVRPPHMFNFKSSRGDTIYGMYYLPPNYDPFVKYPTLLQVYGGPHVQLVKNQITLHRQLYSTFGFITVVIDGAGSANRGIEFEGRLREKMGTVELQDQIEGLEYLMTTLKIGINRERIAVSGWSYGGYLSLMAMAQHSDFFKIAICGAPVTLWNAYNTGYTERYMDTPSYNPEGYKKGSVLTYVDSFPDTPNRVILIHGLQDENVHFSNTSVLVEELSMKNKPYILRILGKERHGVRDLTNRLHLESNNINHLLKYL